MNRKNKIVIGFFILILLVSAILTINKNKSEIGEIRIGIIAPLSGPLAEYGEAFKNGVIMATEQNPKTNVSFFFEDSSEDPKKAISAFYKLKDQNGVNVIFNWGAASSQAIAPLIQDSNIVFLSNSSEPEVTRASKYIIRTAYRAEDYASTMWSYFRERGYKDIGIVKLEMVFFNELIRGLEVTKRPDEKISVVDTYLSFGDRDFKTSILKIKSSPVQKDVVGVFLVQGQVSQFYTQAELYGLKVPTFGTDVFESQDELTKAGKYMNGASYALNDFSLQFKNEYRNRFGNIGQISYAANAYDISNMLIKNVDFKDRDSIMSSFKSSDFSGVAGMYQFKDLPDDRSFSAPVVLKTIANGESNPSR